MFFAGPHDSFEDGDDHQGPLLPHGSDPRGGNHLLALRRLLYRMERHEILPAGGGAHDGDENDGLWQQQQQQQQQQQKLQPWHSLRIRADLCRDLWKAVANDHLESEGSGGGNGDTLRLERAGYLELSERVDRACKRAYLLADRAEEEACSGGVPDLVDQLFGSDGENENVDDEDNENDEDNDGASEAEGGPQTQEHGDENDFYDEFEDDDGDEEESSKASSPEEPGASQGRKSRRNTTPTASTTQELQKAQREQIEKAIATMARQMKESTQGIHNRLQEQTGTTLDELETVAEQNVADVSRVAETVASHNTRAAGSRWGSLATMVFLVGLFAVTLLTVFAVPKSPDADLSRILFAREADGVTPRSPAVRLLKSALTRVRGLVAGDDDDDDAYGDDPGEPYDDDERYNELRYEEQREQQRLEKERLEELVRDMKRQKRTARKPPQQEDHRVKEDDDEDDEEDDDDDDDGVAEAELPESDAGSPLRDPPQAPKREHQQQQKQQQQQQDEEEVDPEEEEEESDDGDDDDELNGSYDDDDYNEEFEDEDEDGSHEEDEERYKSEEGGDENVEQTIQNQESPKTEPLEEDEETEIEEDEDDDDDYLEDEDEPDNPWGIKPIDDKEELRLQQQQQQQQQQHQEREQSTRQQRRQQRRQDKQQRGAEPTRAEVSVDDILASLQQQQQQQQQAPGDPLVSAGGPPSASEKDAPGSGFRRDGIATQQIAPQELRIAAASNDLASLERYLDVAPQHANRQDKRGWTALHYASHHGNLGAVRLLLGHGDGESEWEIDAGIKSFDETPQTAFDVALAVHGIDHPVARAFVESGWRDGGESDERVRRVLDEKKRRDEKDKRLADKAERERLAIQQKRDRMFGDLSRYRAINKNGGDLDDDDDDDYELDDDRENESEVELRRKRLDALLGGEL